jgi:hypothetical protein
VPNDTSDTVSRVRASDGRLLETWTGANSAFGVLVAEGLIYITGATSPGRIYLINPRNAPGVVTYLTSNLGNSPLSIAYDGVRIWTANFSGSVSSVTHADGSQPEGSESVNVTTVSAGFDAPLGILYDGANIWVTDTGDDTLKKLNADGLRRYFDPGRQRSWQCNF